MLVCPHRSPDSTSDLSRMACSQTYVLRHAGRCCYMRSNSSFAVLFLLTFLPTLRQLAMDIRRLPFLASYIGTPHPFGSCSRLVPDGCASDSLSRTMPEIRSKQESKSTVCAVTRRCRGKYAMRSFRFLGEGVSTGLQV